MKGKPLIANHLSISELKVGSKYSNSLLGSDNSKSIDKLQNSCPLPIAYSLFPKSGQISDTNKIGLL